MTNRHIYNMHKACRFGQNINKLTKGKTLTLSKVNSDFTETVIAKVRCDTVGERPRKFSIIDAIPGIPLGGQYTIKNINSLIYDFVF